MALDLDNLFQVIGRAGRNAYLVNLAQSGQPQPFQQLAGYPFVNPSWIATLAQTYDQMIRSEQLAMSLWTGAVTNILLGAVAADNPNYGTSLSSALSYFHAQMVLQNATVAECTITKQAVPDDANVGNGSLFVTLIRGDGIILQNTVAEETTLLITADSFTGGRVAGREPWQWNGAPNVSSLGTGTGVGLWDWDWPQGSSASASGQCISASQYATAGGNLLANGDFASWTSATNLDYWYLQTGVWGTTILRETSLQLGGDYCVRFVPGATLNALTQTFGSSVTDGTDPDAGTSASLIAFTGYAFNIWLKADPPITGGVLTVSLVDGNGLVVDDQAGTPNTYDIILSTVSAADWAGYPIAFRTPVAMPDTLRLKIAITTALSGAALFLDWAAACQPTNAYPGGPNLALFSNPAAPYEAVPDPDGYTITFGNDRAGQPFGKTFQALFAQLFQTPPLILPYAAAPSISDNLIAAGGAWSIQTGSTMAIADEALRTVPVSGRVLSTTVAVADGAGSGTDSRRAAADALTVADAAFPQHAHGRMTPDTVAIGDAADRLAASSRLVSDTAALLDAATAALGA